MKYYNNNENGKLYFSVQLHIIAGKQTVKLIISHNSTFFCTTAMCDPILCTNIF